ncbi:MAG: VWA domain-containing protein [Candidatus Aenigmatarchaeota archaeon]
MELTIFSFKILLNIPERSMLMLLALIIFTIASYVLMIRMRRKRVAKFANFATLRRIHGYKLWVAHPSILILKIIVIVLLFLIATQSLQVSLIKKVSNADFVLAIDSSPSMLLPDYEPNRIEFVKKEAIKWSEKLKESNISVVKFSDKAIPITKLTNNMFEIEKGINNIAIDLASVGTALGDALKISCSILSESEKDKKIVLIITDGKSNIGINVTDAIESCNKINATIYPVAIVPTEKTREMIERLKEILKNVESEINYTIEEISYPEPDEKELEAIAILTNGELFSVRDEAMLSKVFEKITIEEKRIMLNSDYYILLFITFFLIIELMIYAKLGAL